MLCQKRGARLTPLREKVLTLVWKNHSPIGAYDILTELIRQESRQAQPPTVYRALDFLQEQGLIHRLSSINAYIGCTNPVAHTNSQHRASFFICSKCRITLEVDSTKVANALNSCAQEHAFSIEHGSIEITGLCFNCNKEQD
ncbi:MAG: transcriptional repressor [Endozoicomonas sp. (ex Botrylloides leachii)]|nr:transcriptional repressor [Endozoicomonas sp. (ex Botrylloides leachii)]